MFKRREFLQLGTLGAAMGVFRPVGSWPIHPSLFSLDRSSGARQGLPANWVAIHYQWEFPHWIPDAGKKLNTRDYVSMLVDAGVEAVHVMTRLELGICYFPSAVCFERDRSGRDWMREILDEIAQQGAADKLKVIAYFATRRDNVAAKHRPEWQQRDKEDNPLWDRDPYGQPRFAFCCLNSPYRDYMIAMLTEIADRYPEIACLWLDTPYYPQGGCYCRWCEDRFRQSRGYPLPRGEKAPKEAWLQMRRFQGESVLTYLEDFKKRVIAAHPHLTWTWNSAQTPYLWESQLWMTPGFNSNEVETGYLEALFEAKRLQNFGRPFELTLGNDYTWTDQRVRPEHELKTFQAISLSHGGGLLIGDYPYPDGRFREHTFEWCKGVFHWKKAIQEWVRGAENLPEVALFDGHESRWLRFAVETEGRELQVFPPNLRRGLRDRGFYAWAQVLSAANVQFDVLTDARLDQLPKYKLVILPDQLHLSEETVQAVEKYVRAGGNLIASYRTGLYTRSGQLEPSGLWEILGLDFRELSAWRGSYIRLTDTRLEAGLSPNPLLVMGRPILAVGKSAETLGGLTFPIAEVSPETRIWWAYNPPQAAASQFPSVSLNRWGKGQAMYLANPVEERFVVERYWGHGLLLLNAVRRLLGEQSIQVRADSEIRAIAAVQKGERRIVLHLLNEAYWVPMLTAMMALSAMQESATGMEFSNLSPFPWKHRPVHDAQVELQVPFSSVARVYEAPSRRKLHFHFKDGKALFVIPEVDTHTVIVVEA